MDRSVGVSLQRAVPIAAASLPSLLAFNVSPSPTFLNQALAFAAWGVFAWTVATDPRSPSLTWRDLARGGVVLAALGLLIAAALWSWIGGALPASLAWSVAGTLLAAAVMVGAGSAAARGQDVAVSFFFAFLCGWIVAGLLNAAIAFVQVFQPGWADGQWIAHSSLPGRAVGNLRQPNHLSSLLLWSAIAVVGGLELGRLGRRVSVLLMATLVGAVVLTASRTGVIGVVLLAIWGTVDRRLTKDARLLLGSAPVQYAAWWLVMTIWASAAGAAFGGQQRLGEADLSASRFSIWHDTLTLIRANPWRGVGVGEFNFAWSLSSMPTRPTAFFDHSHNLFLQLAVELGIPLAAIVIGLLGIALWRGARRGIASRGDSSVVARCAAAMLVLIGLHSMLEYPLWYSYFLLPAAWVFGFLARIDMSSDSAAPPVAGEAGRPRTSLAMASATVVIATALAVFDYARVAAIFSSDAGAPPLSVRIDRGRRSVLFSHHADYAAATVAEDPARELPSFGQAAHYLLDTRLMMAWAQAYANSGDQGRARYLAQRLREFKNPHSAGFFAACSGPAGDTTQPEAPYQCMPPAPGLDWRSFLAR